MNHSLGSTRTVAGLATFLVVFFAPQLLAAMFPESLFQALWGLVSLAAAAAVICLVRLHQRMKQLEAQASLLQELLDRLEKRTDALL